MNPRFTIDGSDSLERFLAQVCERVSQELQRIVPADTLEAVLLGGGYGRGQGGVMRTAAGDRPYNDLEFYVFLRGSTLLNERKYGSAFRALAEELSAEAGVEVEMKVSSRSKLRRSEANMFYYDLLLGHRRTFGDPKILDGCEHHCDASQIPLHEATRLLMNRCSGLLFAQEQLSRDDFTSENADFVGRNQAKAQLAFGDVVLTTRGMYDWDCNERHRRLLELRADLPWLDAVRCHHAAGLEFKLHPVRKTGPRESFWMQQQQLCALAGQVWLWLENQRLKQNFASAREYGLSDANKCPETSGLRNRLINVKAFGPAGLLGRKGARYPRERLLNALPLLLWETLEDREVLARVQKELRSAAKDFSALVRAYRGIWERFN